MNILNIVYSKKFYWKKDFILSRKPISESVKKQLYAESMGRCMNPACRCDVIYLIMEKI